MAVDAVPATHHAGVGATVAAVDPNSSSTRLAARACAVCIAASACNPTLLSYHAAFAASVVCFARAVWPDRGDAVLGPLGAYVQRKALLARADLEADLCRLRDAARAAHPATCAGAEDGARLARDAVAGWAGAARRRAEDKWGQYKDVACAAWFVLCLLGRGVRLAATMLLDAAYEEAAVQAPAALAYLRRAVDGIRSLSGNNTGGQSSSSSASGFVFKDVVCLVGIGFYLLVSVHLLSSCTSASGVPLSAACFAATCGLTTLAAHCIDPPDQDDTEEADTTGDDRAEGDAVGAGEAMRDAELEVRESWRFLWVLVLIAYCADAFFLRVTLGEEPIALAILALSNFKVLSVGRQVQLTPPGDGEGAPEGAVSKWRRGAMVVLAASSVKIFAIYLVIDCYLAALSFLWLCVMADFLLAEEDKLSDFLDASPVEDDEDGEEESADFDGGITGGNEEEADEASETSSSEDDDEEEAAPLEKHCDSSEEHENVEEQRQEEQDSGSGTDDGWDLVEVDPEMPFNANSGANQWRTQDLGKTRAKIL